MKTIRTLIAAAALMPALAMAGPLKPGEYSIGGYQQICIVADGSWYGTTFPDWGGLWIYDADTKTTSVFGNYASGAGNDSMAIKAGSANWTEWRDDQGFQMFVTKLTFTKLSNRCSAQAVGLPPRSNPLQ